MTGSQAVADKANLDCDSISQGPAETLILALRGTSKLLLPRFEAGQICAHSAPDAWSTAHGQAAFSLPLLSCPHIDTQVVRDLLPRRELPKGRGHGGRQSKSVGGDFGQEKRAWPNIWRLQSRKFLNASATPKSRPRRKAMTS